jgi:hypothetical protein
MLGIPRRLSHFVYGIIQWGLTCAIAAAIARFSFADEGTFIMHWFRSWGLAWLTMLPMVVFAAPLIRKLTDIVTVQD